jgi:hypothetical protein
MPQPIYDLLGVALRLLDMQGRANDAKDFAGYSLEWLPLAANAQRQKATFTINSDVDFVALSATWYATDTANPPAEVLAPMITFNLSLADRQIYDKDTFLKAAFGQQITNGFPLMFPLWLPRSTTLNGFMTNLDAANARTVRLTFQGFILHAGRNANTSRQGGF